MREDTRSQLFSCPEGGYGFRSLTIFSLGSGAIRSSPGTDPTAAGPTHQGSCSSWQGLGAPAPPAGPIGQCEGRSLPPDPGERPRADLPPRRPQDSTGCYQRELSPKGSWEGSSWDSPSVWNQRSWQSWRVRRKQPRHSRISFSHLRGVISIWTSWLWISAPTHSCCVTLEKLLNLSAP